MNNMSKPIRGRFYCQVESNGERAVLVVKASSRLEAKSIIQKTYKVDSVLNVSDTYRGISNVQSYVGGCMGAGIGYFSGNRSSRRGSI
jgi:hypothetical protein